MTNIVLNYERTKDDEQSMLKAFGVCSEDVASVVSKFKDSEFYNAVDFVDSLVKNGEITGGQLMAMATLGFQTTIEKLMMPDILDEILTNVSEQKERGND